MDDQEFQTAAEGSRHSLQIYRHGIIQHSEIQAKKRHQGGKSSLQEKNWRTLQWWKSSTHLSGYPAPHKPQGLSDELNHFLTPITPCTWPLTMGSLRAVYRVLCQIYYIPTTVHKIMRATLELSLQETLLWWDRYITMCLPTAIKSKNLPPCAMITLHSTVQKQRRWWYSSGGRRRSLSHFTSKRTLGRWSVTLNSWEHTFPRTSPGLPTPTPSNLSQDLLLSLLSVFCGKLNHV